MSALTSYLDFGCSVLGLGGPDCELVVADHPTPLAPPIMPSGDGAAGSASELGLAGAPAGEMHRLGGGQGWSLPAHRALLKGELLESLEPLAEEWCRMSEYSP